MGQQSSKYATAVEAEIEASKVHWSELRSDHVGEQLELQREERAEDNRKVFRDLQMKWPAGFFGKRRVVLSITKEDEINDVVLGEKIAEGGQADIYRAHQVGSKVDTLVMKVFKLEGASLHDLQHQLPPELFQNKCEVGVGYTSCCCWTLGGMLLDDGRFAVQMDKYWGDLRQLIDLRVQGNNNQGPPFSTRLAYRIMLEIAKGMQELQESNIRHRDLKASNVLICSYHSKLSMGSNENNAFGCFVADYECSVGVLGTGFWRAPEILRDLKDIRNKPELFLESADVYSYAMTCYEVLTGKFPFEDVRRSNHEAIYSGQIQLQWPSDIDPEVKVLLESCSHLQPSRRPSFRKISFILHKFVGWKMRQWMHHL